jgi:hypothetical protein
LRTGGQSWILPSFGWLVVLHALRRPPSQGIGPFTVILCFMMWNWLLQTGLAMLLFPSFVDDQMDGFGNARYRPQEIITICVLRWTFFPGASSTPDVVSGSVLESMKIANQGRQPAAVPRHGGRHPAAPKLEPMSRHRHLPLRLLQPGIISPGCRAR